MPPPIVALLLEIVLLLTDVGHHRYYFDAVKKTRGANLRVSKVKRYGWDTITITPDFRASRRAAQQEQSRSAGGIAAQGRSGLRGAP